MANTSIWPRLSNLDELFKLDEANNAVVDFPQPPQGEAVAGSVLATLPLTQLNDFPNHPFRLYSGERKDDMVDSIREKGILQPLIVRALDDGQYHILSGHNRKYCGIEAGLDTAPVIIKHNLSDDEAWVYVIETNLIQRSFADMLPSEKAAVLHMQHSKMFSQGKRTDIINELEHLSNPHDNRENGTSVGIPQKLDTRKSLANEYGLKTHYVAQLLRIHLLSDLMKNRLDNGEFANDTAETLSHLTESEQKELDKCINATGFKVDMRKANVLRDYSKRNKLDDEKIYLILNNELGMPPKKNRTPTVKVSKSVFAKYFTPKQSAKDIQDYVEKALDFYSAHLNNSRENETPSDLSAGNGYSADEDSYEPEM